MDFPTFSARAQDLAAAFPKEFLEGIEAIEVHEDVKGHPYLEGVVTLGECAPSPLTEATGIEQFHSIVHLYYGSFVELAGEDPHFDLEAELEETLEHEIQHHIEDRAGIKTLRDEDDLFEAHARFRAGLEVAAGWYRQGEPVGPSLWAVDLDLFLELEIPRRRWGGLLGTTLMLDVLGTPLELAIPEDASPDEIWTLEGEGLLQEDEAANGEADPGGGPGGDLHVVPVLR